MTFVTGNAKKSEEVKHILAPSSSPRRLRSSTVRIVSSSTSRLRARPERYRDREVSVGVERDTRADARGRHEFMLQRAESDYRAVREMVLVEKLV